MTKVVTIMKLSFHFLSHVITISGILLGATYSMAAGTHDFIFNLHIPKNTCEITVEGNGQKNIVDFGSVPLNKFKGDAAQGKIKLPFNVVLTNCKTKNYEGNYIKLTGNYTDNDGFLDDADKSFAVRISEKESAVSGDNVFFTQINNKMWKDIVEGNNTKTFYAYVMCKNSIQNCADDKNVGKFKVTLTLTYVAD